MGDWSRITGEVRIRKSNNISLSRVVYDCLTDEYSLDVKTERTKTHYIHTIDLTVSMDVMWVAKQWDEFKKALKSDWFDLEITGPIY